MPSTNILNIQDLGPRWPALDPFLFCVYHDDAYPRGNAQFGPDASLAGRQLGSDFAGKDGWRMYHGETVPGFPAHPHRGFETVTIVRSGLIDHSDSLGASARFGNGDVQWLTAGRGIVHAEMFPLLKADAPNRLELFQIWLNLPAKSKMAAPHFTMFWAEDIPRRRHFDEAGHTTEIVCIAGRLGIDPAAAAAPIARDAPLDPLAPLAPLAPPPDSWAAQNESDLAIWTLKMMPGAGWTLPRALGKDTRRMLYFFEGASLQIGDQVIDHHAALELDATCDVQLTNGSAPSEFVLLQGRPIGEPVAQYGPFVMNSEDELRQTFADYQRTQFGSWPWPTPAPIHGSERRRFARHADGRQETHALHALPASLDA